jgi:hypothetical protein
MKVNIDFDTTNLHDLAALQRVFESGDAPPVAPAKPAKAPKPVTPVAGNPDEKPSAPTGNVSTEGNAPSPNAKSAPVAENAPANLRADAPAEIVKLSNLPADKPVDATVLGNAILKAAKPEAEGGLTRPVVVALLEKFRPAGYTEVMKTGKVEPKNYAELRGLILDGYKA